MKFISHRGNLKGKILDKENDPIYIDVAIAQGFYVEVDLQLVGKTFFLGHDAPDHEITVSWLLQRSNSLYIHTKTIHCLEYLLSLDEASSLNYFFHDNDLCTITSTGEIWVHPRSPQIEKSISVMPETVGLPMEDLLRCSGICSDRVYYYKKDYNSIEVNTK